MADTEFLNGEDYSSKDFVSVLYLMAVVAILHKIVDKIVLFPMSKYFLKAPVGKGKTVIDYYNSPKFKIASAKFVACGWKFICYGTLFLVGIFSLWLDNYINALSEGSTDFRKGWLFAGQGPNSNFIVHPKLRMRSIKIPDALGLFPDSWALLFNLSMAPLINFEVLPTFWASKAVSDTLTSPILFHYQLGLAYYGYSLFMEIFDMDGPKQKDKMEMIIHHIVTIFLIGYSWHFKLFRIGCAVFALHDLSDPFMESAKFFLYTGREILANIFFLKFATVFIASRCYVFPQWFVYPTAKFAYENDGKFTSAAVGLSILQLLHIFWASLIIKMIVQSLSGGVKGDIRDEE